MQHATSGGDPEQALAASDGLTSGDDRRPLAEARQAATGLPDAMRLSLAHDLNNVLGVIMNFAALAHQGVRRLTGDESARDAVVSDLERIENATKRGIALVNRCLGPDGSLSLVSQVDVFQSPGSASEPTPTQAGSEDGLVILVVDDDADMRASLSRLLRQHGHQVATAAGSSEALELLAARHFELLVSDNRMAGLSGTRLAQRALAAYPHLKVVVMSGAQLDQPEAWMDNGRLRFLEKPFCEDDLIVEVRAMAAAAHDVASVEVDGD